MKVIILVNAEKLYIVMLVGQIKKKTMKNAS